MNKRLFLVFSSWWFTAAISLGLVFSYIYFLFGSSSYDNWAFFVFHTPAGLGLYMGLIVNLLLASVRIVFRRLSPPEIRIETVRAMDAFAELNDVSDDALGKVFDFMRLKGFRCRRENSYVYAGKNRFSFLPGTVLQVGLVIALTASLFSVHVRKSQEVILREGKFMDFPAEKILISSISPDLPPDFLQIGQEDIFRLGNVSAKLQVFDDENRSYVNSRINSFGFPVNIKGVFYRIRGLGITLPVELKRGSSDLNQIVDIDLLPPGRTDTVALSGGDKYMTFALQPEKVIAKGLFKGKQYNLRNLFYHVVLRQDKDKGNEAKADIMEGTTAKIGDDKIFLGKHTFHVKIQYVDDPALIFVYAGMIFILAGIFLMPCRFFWYEKELLAVWDGGLLHMGYREEFYKKWGIQKFHVWLDNLSSGNETAVKKS